MRPLIDRELFFGDPELSGAQLSPDGRFISFVKPYRGVRNIWVKETAAGFETAKPITADDRPVPGYFWSRDGQRVLYVQDKGGNEDFHVYSVDPRGEIDAESGVPSALDLTPLDGVRARINSLPKSRPGVIFVGLNDRDPRYHDVYEIDIATGERSLVQLNEQGVGGYVHDLTGTLRLAVRQTPSGGSEILRVDGDTLTQLYEVDYLESANPIRFHKDGQRVYLTSNKGDDVDLARLMLMDVESGALTLVEEDPEGQVDFGGATFGQDDDELIATAYVGDRLRLYPHDPRIAEDLDYLRRELPDGELSFVSSTRDMRLHLVAVTRDVDPGSVYLFTRETRELNLVYRSRPDLPSEQLAPMTPIRYTARDGLEIPAYLTLPADIEPNGLPLVLHPHGGPWARDAWGYDPYAQFLANRGYAVLQPNFRCSTGFGKAFLNAGSHEWGTGAMQHDLSDGVRHLVERGIVDEERVCIFGGSYGGYATLAGVTFTPELYACGIPYVAPSNLVTLIESFPEYWKPFLKGSWYLRVGDPSIPEERAELLERSPLEQVEKIRVPLLVVHGANDPRVKQAESDQIVVALREKGAAVEYIVAPDEGHGFTGPENRMALAVAIENFLAKHLGGRRQDEVPDALAAHLGGITVDVATVADPREPTEGD